jgi:apolipoprotein D and lipocalin family protein
MPEGAIPVKPFDKTRYLGKWYEIARLDFKYERNLNNTTAVYSINKDGSIRVENRGYDVVKKTWKQAIGKAKFVGDEQEARLKVSFFGPFYAGYNVIGLDPDYRYALVAGGSLKYLWILSRETTIPDKIKQDYLHIADTLGYNTSDLIWVVHDNN